MTGWPSEDSAPEDREPDPEPDPDDEGEPEPPLVPFVDW